jgi:hypothetical protein
VSRLPFWVSPGSAPLVLPANVYRNYYTIDSINSVILEEALDPSIVVFKSKEGLKLAFEAYLSRPNMRRHVHYEAYLGQRRRPQVDVSETFREGRGTTRFHRLGGLEEPGCPDYIQATS